MKRLFTLLLLMTLSQIMLAQNYYGLSIRSTANESFYLFINGRSVSSSPMYEYKDDRLTSEDANVAIVIASQQSGTVSQSIRLRRGTLMIYTLQRAYYNDYRLYYEKQETLPMGRGVTITINGNGSQQVPSCTGNHNHHVHDNKCGHGGYYSPMDENTFTQVYENIKKQSFDSDKVKVAKIAVSGNTMTSDHVKRIMQLLSYDSNRLAFAKYAYDYVYDKNLYFLVTEAFDFSSSKQNLMDYISKK